MSDPCTLEVTEGVAAVRFDRPARHNSLSLDMFEAIVATLERIERDPSIRAVVLAGNGPGFCAGLDLDLMKTMIGDGEAAGQPLARLMRRDDGPDNLAQRAAYGWKRLAIPVIAAIHGVAFGGGMQIALGCDIRIASPDAKLSIMEARYGLIPDMSITATLPDLVSRDVALELTLSARVFDAREAHALGLVTRLAEDPLTAAAELAAVIASRSPEAVRAVKQLYNNSWRVEAERGMRLEEQLQLALIGQPNQREAVAAALERRQPGFRDPAV